MPPQISSTIYDITRDPPSTTSSPSQLPNELLLDVFLQVARLHPTALTKLYGICQHWYSIIKAYEDLLWHDATLSAFPGIAINRDLSGYGGDDGTWKQTYSVQHGWLSKRGLMLAVEPCRPPAILIQDSTDSTQSVEVQGHLQGSSEHDHPHQHQHHLHNYTLDHIRDHNPQEQMYLHRNDSASSIHEPPMVVHSPADAHASPEIDQPSSILELTDALCCNLCTYADICLVPQARIGVRTHRSRSRPLIQILSWSLQEAVDIDDTVNSHQDLVSGMAVNDQGTFLVSCSIDGTVRVWDIDQAWCCAESKDSKEGRRDTGSFARKIQECGYPIRSRRVLLGHVGWVNAVAIENTSVVSGGSDHTVRVWDAPSGSLLRLIPNLFLSRDFGFGVYAVAIHGSLVGSGSIIEGYQIHDKTTGKLVMDLDEPLPSKDHYRFEDMLYQHYASKIAITDTVIVTNSKMEGMLCVWSRETGQFMYRIRVCPQRGLIVHPSLNDNNILKTDAGVGTHNLWSGMVTQGPNASDTGSGRAPSSVVGGDGEEAIQAIHTFKVNSSGSMVMCTLCDGRVSLFEFGTTSGPAQNAWAIERSGHGALMSIAAETQMQTQQQEHQCGTLAWIWTRDSHGANRLVLV
ncbi:WD40-repeat-containing domain protein [Dissophora ornata]|nr:hypothetical protein BGZ58_005341 [Dissophora ornata]KAI8603539.1 WD40-repeat-containing domain protein [Dissophora ornata]